MMHLYITSVELNLLSETAYELVMDSQEIFPDECTGFKIFLVSDSLWFAVQNELDGLVGHDVTEEDLLA